MLSQEQIESLTTEQKAAYQRYEQTFQSDGWEDVEKWANAQATTQGERMLAVTGWDGYLLARGARAAFISLAQLRETTEAEFAEFAAQAQETAITLDEIAHE